MDNGSVGSRMTRRRMLKIIPKCNTTLKKVNKLNFSCVIFCYIVDVYVFNNNKAFNYLHNLKLEKDRRFQILYSLI